MNTRGFSLLEVVVALLVLSLGLLGAAAVMAAAVRAAGEGTVRVRATALGVVRRETLVAGGCAAAGSTARDGIVITWSAAGAVAGGRARVVVERPTPRGPRTDTLAAVCRP